MLQQIETTIIIVHLTKQLKKKHVVY